MFLRSKCACACAQSLSCSQTLCNPMDCSPSGSPSMEFSRQKYWSRLPFPSQGDLPNLGIELTSLASLPLAGRFFIIAPPGKPHFKIHRYCYQFSSVTQWCPTLCNPMNCSMPGLPVHYQLPEFTKTHVHWVGDAIQPSHPLSSPSPPTPNPSQHQGLFQWVSSSHEQAKVLEFQLQHQFFQWTPRTNL